jgi:hypothetical protein
MSETKPVYNSKRGDNGRFRFSALDMLKQARGLPTPEGYVVVTKDFTEYLQAELTRLYAIEDLLRDHAVGLAVGDEPDNTIPDLFVLCHIEVAPMRAEVAS